MSEKLGWPGISRVCHWLGGNRQAYNEQVLKAQSMGSENTYTLADVQRAVAAEREACAKMAEEEWAIAQAQRALDSSLWLEGKEWTARVIAQRIRSRK